MHHHDLTDGEYQKMRKDLAELMKVYNYIYKELDETQKPYNPHISFYNVKRLSMEKLPNSRNTAHEFVA